jgi:hypothetical protein
MTDHVYVALWDVNFEGQGIVGVFRSEQDAKDAAIPYNRPNLEMTGVVEKWEVK